MTFESQPLTRTLLASEFRRIGLATGMVVLVHSSLRSLGWVNGGPVTVIHALMDVLSYDGTLVMPAHSGDYSDPAGWRNPPAPEPWHETIRNTMPAFDPQRTPTWQMGRIPELFRTWPGVRRSSHPQVSFAAWGRHADDLTSGHGLSYSLGEDSPLARLYDQGGYVLLLGVGYNRNTSFHLAEYRVSRRQEVVNAAPIIDDGQRIWKSFRDISFNDGLFGKIGFEFENTDNVAVAKIGSAESRFFPQRASVDYAEIWLNRYYGQLGLSGLAE